MTTTDARVLHSRARAQEQAIRGIHAPLICVETTGDSTLVGKPLDGQTITTNGDYTCLIPLAGLADSVSVHMTATLTTKTATSAGPDSLADFDPKATNVASAVVLTAGSGDGALTTTVRQTATLTVDGALYARYTLTVAGAAGSVAITEAEVVGL